MNNGHFYITLPSSGSRNTYPNNTLAQYMTELAKPIEFVSGEYEVALVELQINASVENLTEKKHLFDISRNVKFVNNVTAETIHPAIVTLNGETYRDGVLVRDIEGLRIVSMDNVDYYFDQLYLPPGDYNNIETLLKAMNKELAKSPIGYDLKFRIVVEAETPVIAIESTRDYDLANPENFVFSPSPWFAYNISRASVAHTKGGLIFKCTFKDMFKHPGMAYIYCNVVDYQLVGGTQTRLLRIVNLPINTPHMTTIYDNPHYVPCVGGSMRTIEVDIRTVEGQKFPFARGALVIKLHFRKI